jgi:hypothetical protein
MGLHGLLCDSPTFLYVDFARTSQEAHAWASTSCYRDSCTFSYADDVHTSKETHVWTTTCYGDSFTFLYADVRTSQEAHVWSSAA